MTETRAPAEVMPLAERTRVLLPGLYAWLLTVELPALARGVRPSARLVAIAALLALVLSVVVAARRVDLARLLGIYVFIGLCVVTWTLIGSDLSAIHTDRIRSALGMLGWVLYAFGWGRMRAPLPAGADANAVAGSPLIARTRLHRRSVPVVVFAVVSALVLVALAFRVDRPEHAVLAHATAAACSLLVLAVGARVALAQGTRIELPSGSTRLNGVAVRGAVLSVLFGVGLVWAALK
jgi:hypothetical protein